MNYEYDDELKSIAFYQLHPSYLPFVGANYNEYRILHIGESHYCDKMDVEKFNIHFFSAWFDAPCSEVESSLLKNNITRRVADDVVRGARFTIFDNVLRSFLKIVKGENNPHISKSNRRNYNYYAFMNFYPMPAFKAQGSFVDSVIDLSKKQSCHSEAELLLKRCETEATIIVDDVIDVLQPRCVVFSSCDAWSAYIRNGGKHQSESRMIFTSHPARPFTWNKPLQSLNYSKGIDVLENGLRDIYKVN